MGTDLVIGIMAVIAGMLQSISVLTFTHLLLPQGIVGTALVIGIMAVVAGMLQLISILTFTPLWLPQDIVGTTLVFGIMAVIAGMLQSISILTFTPLWLPQDIVGTALVLGIVAVVAGMLQSISILTFTHLLLLPQGIVGTALVIGIMAVIAGMLLLLLPETRGRMLPQTVADAERMEGWVRIWNTTNCRPYAVIYLLNTVAHYYSRFFPTCTRYSYQIKYVRETISFKIMYAIVDLNWNYQQLRAIRHDCLLLINRQLDWF